MNGSGCKNCPVNPCETTNYRGSTCAAQRAKFGLGDPQTNADRIRAMSDEELANHLYLFHGLEEQIKFCQNLPDCESLLNTEDGIPEEKCVGCLLAWLKQPAEETNAPT